MTTGERSQQVPVWYGKIRFNMVLYISYLYGTVQYNTQCGVKRYGTDALIR